MGGNALKIVKTRRYSKKEYEKILLEVGSILTTMDVVFNIPESYGAKESFGDLDVLILSESLKNNILSIIKDKYSPNEIHHNGNVYSFDYKEFQIDFIVVGEENWHTSKKYFEFNDLGNLIGRIAYQMGFRYVTTA